MNERMSRHWDRPFLDSKIRSANTTHTERVLGYFVGPCFVYMAYYAIAGTYLTQFYTDVLGIGGVFLTMMPLLSKIVDAITNIVMGRIIDQTRTKQGKARPWILISGALMAITGCLLYMVPRSNYAVQIIWIIVSYNLYFALAFTIYNMSHSLMVPLSTRDTKQRDGLAMLTSTGTTMLPGLLTTIILPIMIRAFGVGEGAQGTWIRMMSVISILALPATLIEYYFTKERVTESQSGKDAAGDKASSGAAESSVSFRQQVSACFHDKYWLMIMGFCISYNVLNILSTNTILYYANWVLGNSVDSGTKFQVLLNAIGQAPLGFGVFILWPLVRKFGKRKISIIGFVIGAIGCMLVIMYPSNLMVVLIGLFIKSIGALPTYLMAAFMAEAMDHIEYKYGYRADGFTASAQSIIITVAAGLGQTIILGGINAYGYIAPTSTADVITQPLGMRTFFTICFVGVPMLGYLVCAFLTGKFDIDDHMDEISAEIKARHEAEGISEQAEGSETNDPADMTSVEALVSEETEIDRELQESGEKKD